MRTLMPYTAAASSASSIEQYLSFFVAGEELALPILRVVEIVAYEEPSRVPNAPSFLRGVVAVRGQVVPALDLAQIFGFEATRITRRACIVLVEIAAGEHPTVVGVVVENVSEVADVPRDAVIPPPAFGTPVRAAFLTGLYPARGKLVFVLDIDRVLSEAELAALAEASERAESLPPIGGDAGAT